MNTTTDFGHQSAYIIKVVLSDFLLKSEKAALEAAITSCLHDCVAGAFVVDDEDRKTIIFYREAEIDAPSIRKNYQGPDLQDAARVAYKQLAAELENCDPSNEHLLEIIAALKDQQIWQVSMENVKGLQAFIEMELKQERDKVAEFEFANYEFGEIGVQDSGGWESSSSVEKTRPIFITDDEAEEDDAPTVKINFTVRFKPWSSEVEEAYAMTENGNFLGKRYTPSAQTTAQADPGDISVTALVDLLADSECVMNVVDGVLWLETSEWINLNFVKKSLQELVDKAAALDVLMVNLSEMGFGSDEPINGGDCVESVANLYKDLTERFPKA